MASNADLSTPKVRPPRVSAHSVAPRNEEPDQRYKTVLCKHFERDGECKFGDKCSFAHGEAELKQKALPKAAQDPLYKTVLCKHFEQNGKCKFGRSCSFAHGKNELKRRPVATVRQPKPTVQRVRQVPAFEYNPEEFPALPVATVLSAVDPRSPRTNRTPTPTRKMNPDAIEFVPSSLE